METYNLRSSSFARKANGSGEEVSLEEGNIFLIRYSAVRNFIVNGDVELI